MQTRKPSLPLTVLLAVSAIMLLVTVTHAQTESVLYSFSPDSGGDEPRSPLIFDSHGNLYGTTPDSGDQAGGTAFELQPKEGKWTFSAIYTFGSPGDANESVAGLVMDSAGNLYGTTYFGGAYGYGTVFELKPSNAGWTEEILHSFNNNGKDGTYPSGSLILDTSGNLYGTTSAGGSNFCAARNTNCGTVFELVHTSGSIWSERILHNFGETGDSDGYTPVANLVFDGSGDLYGTTVFGGSGSEGTVFELVPRSSGAWAEKILYNFGSLPDGENPGGGLVFDTAGNLYGYTSLGGSQASASGTVFELSPGAGGTWTEAILYSFGASGDATYPAGAPVFDGQGNLWGTSEEGGLDDAGTLFELSASGGVWSESLLYSFVEIRGYYPYGAAPEAGVILDAAGNVYGTSAGGGIAFFGTVFKFVP
jgi:uncharacterized repeat protein (TIGR03803 family)